MYKKSKKMVAAILILAITFANISTIGVYGKEVYASSIGLENQTAKTNNSNVEFDAYFTNNEKATHSDTKQIDETNYIYTKLDVKQAGYLKSGKIEFADSEGKDSNFKINNEIESSFVAGTNSNSITLNQVNNGNTVELQIPIEFITSEQINLADLNKENIVKFTGIYVDEKGKENKIEKEITVGLAWTANGEAVLEQQISKFIPYNINGEKGLILQTIVKSNVVDNVLPTKQTNIEISAPNINNIKPTEVKVLASTIKATNGDETGKSFSEENYTYNEETNKLNIQVNNGADTNGNVSWKKEAVDEFVVTYVYSEEALNSIGESGVDINIVSSSEVMLYGSTEISVKGSFNGTATLKDQISNIVDFSVETTTQLSKGQIYANYSASEKVETEYNERITANIGLADLTDKIKITQDADNFVKENSKGSTTVSGKNYAYYKTLTIEKDIFNKLFGEEGYIDIYVGQTVITRIDKDTEINDNGYIVVDLSELNINSLVIETSKPISEGKLTIDVLKGIKGNIDYSKYQMKEFEKLEMTIVGQAINGETTFVEQTEVKEIPFVEPTSMAELIIDNTNLSTVVTNQNVKMTAVLKTDSVYCNLYQNPIIVITLPSYVENINVKDIQVLFDDELKIKNANLVNNADGTKSIVINLEGVQTKYNIGAVSGGTNIVITADITLNKLTPNKQDQIKMTYTNSNVITTARTVTAEQNEVSAIITYKAPTGVVATNSIGNYAEGAQTLTSITGESQIATIPTMSPARTVNFEMNVINNYSNTIDNISVLGRIPFKGNKSVSDGADLGSTMDMQLKTAINVSGIDSSKITVYYSTNGEATKDLGLASNGWTTSPASYESVKSYLIVLNNHIMNQGDMMTISYNAEIPANLEYNQSAYANYIVYFNNNLATGTIQDTMTSAIVGVTTGTGPIIETSLKGEISETTEVKEGQLIKFVLTVKNTGTENATNVKAKINVPSYFTYVEEDTSSSSGYKYVTYSGNTVEVDIGTVAKNTTTTKNILIKVGNISVEDFCKDESHYKEYTYTTEKTEIHYDENGNIIDENGNIITGEEAEKGITTTVEVGTGEYYHSDEYKHSNSEYRVSTELNVTITGNKVNEVTTNTVKNTIVKSYFSVSTNFVSSSYSTIKAGDTLTLRYIVKSYNSTDVSKNTTLEVILPNELTYESIKLTQYSSEQKRYENITSEAEVNYDSGTRKLTINIKDVDGYYGKTLEIYGTVGNLSSGTYEKAVSVQATVTADNCEKEKINDIAFTINKAGIKVSQTSNIPEGSKISASEDFKYVITVQNLSNMTMSGITLTDYLPQEVAYKNITVTYSDGQTYTYSSKNNDGYPEIEISLSEKETVTVEVNVVAKELNKDTQITNKAKLVHEDIGEIETNAISHTIEMFDENSMIDDNNETKRIMGLVWIDSNNNGMRDDDEELVAGVEVMLFNNTTGKLVTDSSGNALKQTTAEDGSYTFKNIPQGKYTVIFLYDTTNYSATDYKKEGVNETKNSDVIDTKITIDGVTRLAGITEGLTLSDSNMYNIDLGLVVNKKFDLSLDKTVSSITVQDSTGTTKYDYNGSKLAKRDLVAKQVASTTIVVEYKIAVKNEGAVAGYVKRIVDYLPSELKFSSELNTDWYTSGNGIIYNSSLANTLIQPGETKEVTLTLTKKMTAENLGLYNNTAEIYEAYNDLGLEDMNSTPGNKVSGENDMSSADVLITVKTGETVLFIGLTIAIIATISVAAYFLKKKIVR